MGEYTTTDNETAAFIEAHRDDDVRRLALKAAGTKGIDLPFALNQIAGRQTARRKLPSWAATDGIVYPPHLSMEQCSSEQTALYKAAVAQRLANSLSSTALSAHTLPAIAHASSTSPEVSVSTSRSCRTTSAARYM